MSMKRLIAVALCFVISGSMSFAIWPKKDKNVVPEFGSRGYGIFPQPRTGFPYGEAGAIR